MEISDETLIKNIREGDSGFFAVIVERYKVPGIQPDVSLQRLC